MNVFLFVVVGATVLGGFAGYTICVATAKCERCEERLRQSLPKPKPSPTPRLTMAGLASLAVPPRKSDG